MKPCPNCGFKDYTGLARCGCTWTEQVQASRIRESQRREELRRKGTPVLVDSLAREK